MLKKIILFFIFISSVNYAQLSNKHWIPPIHAKGGETYVQEHLLYLSTPEPTPFQVTVTDGSGVPITGSPFTISQGNPQSVVIGTVQPSVMMLSLADLNIPKTDKGLIAEGTGEFYASFRLRAQNHAEILVCKGTTGAGTSFRLGSLPMTGTGSIRNFMASFMATENNTVVTLSDYDPGVVFVSGTGNITNDTQTFNLNAGQSVTVSGYTDFPANLSGFVGALLTSNKPIVVNTGNATGGMLSENTGQDFNLDQIVPVDIVGDEYIVVKGNGSANTERPLVIATQDNTQIFINGNTTPVATINAGDYYLAPSSFYTGTANQNMFISSDRPIYLYQIIAGAFSDATSGLNFIPPLSCFWQKSVDMIPNFNSIGSSNYPNSEIIVVTETGSTVSINNVPTTATAQAVTGNTNWVTYRITGLSGNVRIDSTGALAAGVFGAVNVAGFGGYYSGFGSLPQDTEITLCSNQTVNLFNAITGNPEANGTWTTPVGVPPLSGNNFNGAVNTPGDYIYSFTKNCDNSNLVINITVSVTVQQAPFVGSNNTLSICRNASPVDLFTLLGTGITTGGNWLPALASGTGVYNPAVDVSGTYTYTIPASTTCPSVSSSIVVTNNPLPAVSNQTITTCSDVALNYDLDALIAGSGDTFTYTVASSDATNVPPASPRTTASATNITDVYTNTTTAPVIISYTITPISSTGCIGSAFIVAVTVNPEPVVTNQTVATCSDVALNYDLDALVSGAGDAFTYTVASSDATNVPAGNPRTAPTAANISDNYTNTTTAPVIITYTVTPIGSNGCTGNTFTVAVTVNPEPVVTNQTAATCSDVAINFDLDALIAGSGDTFTYTVASSDATNVPAASPRTTASATNITDVYTNTTTAAVTISYTVTPIGSNGCAGNTFTVAVTVNPEPVVTNQTVTTCSDVAINFDLDALIAGTGDTFTYTVASSDATNVPAASPRTTASATNITDVYTNTTTAPVIITYTVTPIGSNGCTGNTFTVAVTVNPEPVVSNQTVTTCSDVALNFDLDALIAGSGDTFTYTVASSDATNVPAASPRTTASATNITDVYTNTTTASVIITYTVTPIGSNGCTGNTFTVAVTVNPEPVVTNQTAATCSDVALNFDLDALIAGTGDTYTYTVASSDATNVPAASPRTTASATNITDVYTNTTTAAVTITYTVTPIGSNGCTGNSFTVAVTVNPEPVVTNQTITTCSDVALNFDLDALIAGTGDTYTYTVASSDATNVPPASPRTTASATNITDVYTNTTTAAVTISYTVTPIGSNSCTGNTFTVAVTVNPEPVVTNQTVATCSDVALNYDLDALVSGAGDTYTYTVASSDATNVPAGNPRTSPTAANITDNYTNTTMVPVIITYTVTPISSNGCIGSTFTVVVTVNPEPVVTNQTVTTCSDVALNYDLASLITGTGDTYTYTVASSDETNVPAGNPRTVASAANITDLYTNTTSAAVTISYTITPIGSNGCTGNSFILAATIHPNPVILPITNFELCDDTTDGDDTNGIVNFNLLLKNSEILGTQTGINITYHTDSNAAILGQNAITNIISTNRIIYVRLTNSTTGCFSTTSFNLVVNPLPVVDSSVELKQCDTDSDAVTDFNLTQANLRISPDTSLTYTYHNSLAGAVNNTDFVTNDIVHTAANGDKVWARITNIFGCSRTSEVNLVVSATTIPPTYTYPLSACDDYLNASDPDGDGIDYFDLTVIEPVLTAQFPVGQSYTYSYYFNEADAISEQNAITNTTNFRNTVPFNQPIWVRIESNLYDCAGLGSYLSLTVNPLPDFDLGQDLILCVDPVTGQGSQILNAIPTTAGTYSYQWTPANPSGNSGLFTITTAGTYSVVVTNTTTGCQSSDSISFTTSSGPATIVAVLTTEAFSSGLATIEAVVTGGFGIYEYSLDGIDWQSSPVFSGLENGSYTIYVRDIQGCDLLPSEPIQTITYPNYFTPNGDGYNDTWMIRLPVNYEAMISIFDRYGKLIKQISSFGAGWDGTYNGNLMPSTDYWFKVEYTENNIRKEFKSHFSLKR